MGYVILGLRQTDIMKAIPVFKWSAVENGFFQVAGTWAKLIQTQNELGYKLWNDDAPTAAVNDCVSLGSFYVPASGAFTLYLVGKTRADGGIIHVLVNDADVAQIDQYGGSVYNVAVNVSLGTLTAGIKHLKFKIASKNGSSSDYCCAFQSVLIIPS